MESGCSRMSRALPVRNMWLSPRGIIREAGFCWCRWASGRLEVFDLRVACRITRCAIALVSERGSGPRLALAKPRGLRTGSLAPFALRETTQESPSAPHTLQEPGDSNTLQPDPILRIAGPPAPD